MRVLVVEDEPLMAEAIRDGLRLEPIAAYIAGDGDTALELLSINDYDIAVLDRDIPGPSADEIAESIVVTAASVTDTVIGVRRLDKVVEHTPTVPGVGGRRVQARPGHPRRAAGR